MIHRAQRLPAFKDIESREGDRDPERARVLNAFRHLRILNQIGLLYWKGADVCSTPSGI